MEFRWHKKRGQTAGFSGHDLLLVSSHSYSVHNWEIGIVNLPGCNFHVAQDFIRQKYLNTCSDIEYCN